MANKILGINKSKDKSIGITLNNWSPGRLTIDWTS